MRIANTLFSRILMERGLGFFERISKISVQMKRRWAKRGKEKAKEIMAKARNARHPEHNRRRKYSREGMESLQNHMRNKVNTPEHYKTRDMSACKTPVFRKMMSALVTESHILKGTKVIEDKETERINDYAGVITVSQLASL